MMARTSPPLSRRGRKKHLYTAESKTRRKEEGASINIYTDWGASEGGSLGYSIETVSLDQGRNYDCITGTDDHVCGAGIVQEGEGG